MLKRSLLACAHDAYDATTAYQRLARANVSNQASRHTRHGMGIEENRHLSHAWKAVEKRDRTNHFRPYGRVAARELVRLTP